MESEKYAHLIKHLDIETATGTGPGGIPAMGSGNAGKMFRLQGQDGLEGMHLSLAWGVHTECGDWHGGLDPHVHSSPECLLFVGLDTASIRYLGAEVSLCLGPEQETYRFNEPTAVIIPPGLPHGPITTERMYSPRGFGCWSVNLHSESEITWLGKNVSGLTAEQRKAAPTGMQFASEGKLLQDSPSDATGKYAHLVKPLKSYLLVERRKINPDRLEQIQPAGQEESSRDTGKPGPGSADHMVWLTGKDLEGLNATIAWGLCSRPGIARRGAGAHVHPVDEVLVYLSMDPHNSENLGAEIEVDLGEEHERHLIDKSTAIVCSAGIPHMPSVTRWVDRPYAFFAVCLSGEHEAETVD